MAENPFTEENMVQVLDWAYEKALNGLPGADTVYELADSYLTRHSTPEDAINSLIKWQNTKSVTSGFVTGVGGFITLPVAIPANISSVLYIQTRMIAAIAHMRGYDLKEDQIQTFVYVALTGHSATGIMKQAGIKFGVNLGNQLVKRVPFEVIKAINKAVGFRLVTKFGQKGIVNLGKAVPLVGGAIGGTVDGFSTNLIGKTAKRLFV
ncbi:EcsC family protein [Oceanobacillus longus]|uniref:EcsC family protein n=1 Tax=Oceanobacillus longus TaxID=930120 RepID=A0ABV8H1E6_9BACI